MTAVDLIVQPQVDPLVSLATDRHLMRAVRRRSRSRSAILRVYACGGDLLGLGRYHLAPPPQPESSVRLWRRHCGGRLVPFGDGFIGVSLILPHRAALFGDNPLELAAYQVINRYVRGILESCRQIQLPAYYPGRDSITVNRRVLAAVSFETDEHGALLFEAIIANTRDFSVLPAFCEAADPNAVVKLELQPPDTVTSLQRELGRELSVEEVADWLRRGYAKQFDLQLEPHELSPLKVQAVEAAATREFRSDDWLNRRQPRADLDRHLAIWAQLGPFEAHLSLQQERFIKEIMFAGDFIANSPALEELERELRLCPLEWRAIDAVTNQIFSKPENFILGVGKLRTIADMIMRGVGS